MKKILLLLLILVFACDSDDSDQGSETFLKKINGIVWDDDKNSLGDMTRHYRFVDNRKAKAEIWARKDYEESDCFEYSTDGPWKIIEHTSDKIVLDDSYEEEGVLYEDLVTLTLEENRLKLVRFNDDYDDFDTWFYEKSLVDINSLKMCN